MSTYKVTFTAKFEGWIDADDEEEATSEVDIPESDSAKYVNNSFEVLSVEKQADSEPPCGVEKPAQDLLRWVERFSEHNHSAGWATDIEYRLWNLATVGKPYATWMNEIEAKHTADMLLAMAEAAGGWWRRNQGLISREFITLDRWRQLYAERE